jgi:hypothetical protein
MLYRLGTLLYITAIKLAAVFGNAKAHLWVSGRTATLATADNDLSPTLSFFFTHHFHLGIFRACLQFRTPLYRGKSNCGFSTILKHGC